MYGKQLYNHWAPPYSIWTPWVKPVLFSALTNAPTAAPPDVEWQTMNVDWAPDVTKRTALILDLPGEVPLLMGLALAQRGYCPVVLYNCCVGRNPAIDLGECLQTLCSGEDALRKPVMAADAPPAFLIDSRRKKGDRLPGPGMFDNRWLVFPQDFPSASFLAGHGIQSATVIQVAPGQPADDLAHVLLRWQEAGIPIETAQVGSLPNPVTVSRPGKFGYAWYTLLARLGLRRSSAGGFGSIIPVPSEGGHRGWA